MKPALETLFDRHYPDGSSALKRFREHLAEARLDFDVEANINVLDSPPQASFPRGLPSFIRYYIYGTQFGTVKKFLLVQVIRPTPSSDGIGLNMGCPIRLSRALHVLFSLKSEDQKEPLTQVRARKNHFAYVEELLWLTRWKQQTEVGRGGELVPKVSGNKAGDIDWFFISNGTPIYLEAKYRPTDWMRTRDCGGEAVDEGFFGEIGRLESVMASCGMYDYAGEWLYRIGMPAKSGVAGGVIEVLPGQLGVGVFSPPLDARGNSVRGIRICDELSRSFDLHLFNNPNAGRSVIRLEFTGAEVNSTRVRTAEESRELQNSGSAIRVFQLQGNLVFSTCEVVARRVFLILAQTDFVLLDLKQVLSMDECAARLLHQLWAKMRAMGKTLLFCAISPAPGLRRCLKAKLGGQFDSELCVFDDSDPALEWCENNLLGRHSTLQQCAAGQLPAGYELFQDLAPDDVRIVADLFERRHYRAGEVMARIGDPSSEVLFIASGLVSVTIPVSGGTQKSLGVFSGGMALGEMGFLDRAPRSAAITAETDVECELLKVDEFERLAQSHPRITIVMLTNMALGSADRLRKATRAISAFDY